MKTRQVDRDSALPLYHQVMETIGAAIRRGDYPPGGKIPPERELCQLLGVSRITVIKALNALAHDGLLVKRVGLGTFVADAPTRTAGSLKGGAVGFVGPLLRGDSFFNDIVGGAENALSERDLSLVLAFSQGTAEGEWRCMKRLKEQGVAGLILYMCDTAASWNNVRRFSEDGAPVVLIDHRAPLLDESLDTVTSDNLKGAFLAVQHLLQLGHRRIALLTYQKRNSSILSREEGWRLALATAGITPDPALIISIPDRHEEPGRKGADALLKLETPATAAFALNDGLAINVMHALEKDGVTFPDRFSMVGFDDNVQATLSHPPLTTIRQHREAVGRTAVELLIARLGDRTAKPRHETLDVELIVRGSTGPVPPPPA